MLSSVDVFDSIQILERCDQILSEEMAITMSHPVAYTKNITSGTQNLRGPCSGVYGPDGI